MADSQDEWIPVGEVSLRVAAQAVAVAAGKLAVVATDHQPQGWAERLLVIRLQSMAMEFRALVAERSLELDGAGAKGARPASWRAA